MNEKINNIVERYVSCPVCRKKADKTRIQMKSYVCDNCGAEYTSLVSKWFVATVLNDPEDREKTVEERLLKYQQALFELAE